jgi:hypothetical protein
MENNNNNLNILKINLKIILEKEIYLFLSMWKLTLGYIYGIQGASITSKCTSFQPMPNQCSP